MKKVFLLAFLFALPAYTQPGMLLWEDVVGSGSVRAVMISGQTVISAESVVTPGNGVDLVVKARDVATGAPIWDDHMVSCCGSTGFLATDDTLVFAAGYVAEASGLSSDIFVRAYNLKTGKVVWTSYWDAIREDYPSGLVVENGRVTVAGTGGIRTYIAATGAVGWTDLNETSQLGIATDGVKVVAAGWVPVVSGQDGLILRAYSSSTGAFVWETRRPTAGGSVKFQAGRLFVTGSQSAAGPTTSLLAAYDINDGRLLWQAPEIPGYFMGSDARAGQIVAVGTGLGPAGKGSIVQSVDPATGAVQWTIQRLRTDGAGEGFRGVAVTEHAVYAIGTAGPDFIYKEMLLRIFDPAGSMLTEEYSHRSQRGDGSSSGFVDIAVDGSKMVAAGSAKSAPGNGAAVVRGYDVSPN